MLDGKNVVLKVLLLPPQALPSFRWTQQPHNAGGMPSLQASLLAAAVPAAS